MALVKYRYENGVYFLCGRAESYDADADAPVHAADERLQ